MKSVLSSVVVAAAALLPATAFAQSEAPPRGHGKAEFLRTYDADLDGVVSRGEFDAQRGQAYARTDSNRDGSLSEAEYVGEYTTRLDAELAATRTRQLNQAHVRFGVMDADHNERMTRAEYDASGARNFTRLDTNGDGRVDDRDTADRY
jgi:hypothetical protein